VPIPWPAATRLTKKLTIFPTKAFMDSAVWGSTFQKILDKFNELSKANNMVVTLAKSDQRPDPNGNGGADVQMDLSTPGQTHSFIYKGSHTGSLLPPPAFNGKCHVVIQGGEMDRAFIFLPIDPRTDASGGRPIGTGLKIAIALHEVLHACGLDDTDPGHQTQLNDPDLFRTGADGDFNFPVDAVPGDPTKPGDRLALGFKKFTPPFFLTARTVGLVRSIWQ
jgi:hypothetical protein